MKSIFNAERNTNCYFPDNYKTNYTLHRMSILDMYDPLIYNKRYTVKETPYYKYLEGDKQPMIDYLNETKGKTWARAAIGQQHLTINDMFDKFENLINSKLEYLEPPYDDHYILVKRDGLLVDGLRRACILLFNGIETVPVAVV